MSLALQISRPYRSNDLAEFIGIMLGDGHIGKEQIQITLSSLVDKNYANYIIKLCKKLFDCNVKVFKKSDCNALCIYCNSINLVRFLTEKGLRIGSKVRQQVGVPEWVTRNKEYSRLCCRGLIDTDGCITIHKYNVKGKQY